MSVRLKILKDDFTVCKVADYTKTDLTAEYCFTGKTDEESSLACPTESVPENATEREDGWKGFRVEGVLDFSLIGILAKITAVLAAEKIGVFVVSTFNTDYVFVKKERLCDAEASLRAAGYEFVS